MNLIQESFDRYTPFRCFRPLSVVSGGQLRSVGCYHCPSCESSRMAEYKRMIQIESSQHKFTYFITLTYDENNVATACIENQEVISSCDNSVLFPNRFDLKRLPTYETLMSAWRLAEYSNLPHGSNYIAVFNRSDIQKFLKRLRKYVSSTFSGEKIRFFAVCEYGPKSLRPHAHILVFSNSKDLFNSGTLIYNPEQPTPSCLPALWSLGRCSAELSKGNCSEYLSSYLVSTAHLPQILQSRFFRPFILHSEHFGFPKEYDLNSILDDSSLFDYHSRTSSSKSLGINLPVSSGQSSTMFYRYPDAFYRYLFPKLPYSHTLEFSELYFLYRLYSFTRSFKMSDTLTHLAKDLVDIYLCPCNKIDLLYDYINGNNLHSPDFLWFVRRLQGFSMVFPSNWDSRKSIEDFFLRLLILSKRVDSLANRCGISRRSFLNYIFRFYQCNESVKLYNFYAAQEFYFSSNPIEDLKYFYDFVFSKDEISSKCIFRPGLINFLQSCNIGIYDSVKKCQNMLTIDHNSKLYENNFVQLYCISDRKFIDWKKSILDRSDERIKHKTQNEIMFNFFK